MVESPKKTVKTDALLTTALIATIVLTVVAFEVLDLLRARRIGRKRMSANGFDASKLTERLQQTRGNFFFNRAQGHSRPRVCERAGFVRQVRKLAYFCERDSNRTGDVTVEERN